MVTSTKADSEKNSNRPCLACTTPLGPESSEGLCPQCLLGLALSLSSSAELEAGEDLPAAGRGLAGLVLGDHLLEALIAQGGMGAVYRARNRKLNRQVAVKIVQAGGDVSPALQERFRIEALAVSSLNHPNVIKIFESGIDHGWHFLVMEWVPGPSLRARLREGSFSFRAAAELLSKIAGAVEHAHQRGVLHRDLKPGNVLINENGEPCLTDFGLAKILEHDSELTISQAVLGTPAYMSPEQAGGASRDITTATDVYGLGAILYELLSGRPPFSAANTPALLRCILEQEPLPLKTRSLPAGETSIPADLAVICLKCLEKSPSRRYRSAAEVADELQRWLNHEPILARPVSLMECSSKWMRRHPLAATLFLALATGLLGILAVSHAYGRKIAAAAELQRLEVVRLQLESGDRYSLQQDPSMALLHFASAWKADSSAVAREPFHRRRLGNALRHTPALQKVWSHDRRVNSVEWSQDGQWVLTASDDGTARLWPLDPAAGALMVLQHSERVSHARFSPDGRWIATLRTNDSGRLWDRSTGQPQGGEFNTTRARYMPQTVSPFDFSPDSLTVLSLSNRDARIREIATGRFVGLPMRNPNPLTQAVFSPDGRRILTITRKGFTGLWDVASQSLLWPLMKLEHAYEDAQTSGIFSPDGSTVFLVSFRGDARLIDVESGAVIVDFTRHPRLGQVVHAGFSPALGRLFTLGMDGALNFWSIPQGEWTGTIPPLSMQGILSDSMASLSPDGGRAAVAAGSGAVSLLELSNRIGSGIVLRHSDAVYGACFSPDGKRVAAGVGNGLVQVWSSSGSEPGRKVSHSSPIMASGFIDSGRRFYTAGQDGLMRFWDSRSGQEAGEPWVHPAGIVKVRFDSGGRLVAVGCVDGGVHVREVDSGRLRFPLLAHKRRPTWLEFSPDGRTLLTLSGNPGNATGDLRLWDAVSGAPLCEMKTIESMSKGGGFLPGGDLVFTWSDDGSVRLWDARTGVPKEKPLQPGEWVPEAAFARDGRRLLVATSSSDNAPRPALVLDLESGLELLRFEGHRNGVIHVRWSPDESHVLTVSNDGSARNWDATNGRPVGRPMQHLGPVLSACYSADGRWIATGSNDRTARVWEAQTGQPVTPLLHHEGDVNDVSFSPDGNSLLTSGEDGHAQVWDISPTAASLEEVAEMAVLLSGHRLNDTGGWVPVTRQEIETLWGRFKDSLVVRSDAARQ